MSKEKAVDACKSFNSFLVGSGIVLILVTSFSGSSASGFFSLEIAKIDSGIQLSSSVVGNLSMSFRVDSFPSFFSFMFTSESRTSVPGSLFPCAFGLFACSEGNSQCSGWVEE